jgi:CHASE2 domain-containing sensor protein
MAVSSLLYVGATCTGAIVSNSSPVKGTSLASWNSQILQAPCTGPALVITFSCWQESLVLYAACVCNTLVTCTNNMTAMSSIAISCLVCTCFVRYIKTKIGEFALNATELYFYFTGTVIT